MIKGLLLLTGILSSGVLWGQADTSSYYVSKDKKPSFQSKIYYVNPGLEIPITALILTGETIGVRAMMPIASLDEAGVLALNPETINSFDRPVAYYNPANFADAKFKSDVIMSVMVCTPLVLLADKRIRKDWVDVLSMLMVTHSVQNGFFYASVSNVRRPRPIAYNPAVPIEDKIGGGKTNSFFSGHVSWTAATTFFIAKVYTDYHNIKGWKRMFIYSVALIPPAVVGYYRTHSGDHFNTDVITGTLIGGICGIVIPELHRIKKNTGVSFQPFSKFGSNGVSVSYNVGKRKR